MKSSSVFSSLTTPDLDDHDHGGDDYLAATLDFNPGHFACDLVLTTELPVHSRLKPSHRPGVASRGKQNKMLTSWATQICSPWMVVGFIFNLSTVASDGWGW